MSANTSVREPSRSASSQAGAAAHPAHAGHHAAQAGMAAAVIGTLGIAFGDIGTSPLYALRVSLDQFGHGALQTEQVLGVLSMIFWSLIIVVAIKYAVFMLRADNRGEGGVLALLALTNPWPQNGRSGRTWLILLGLFGTALLYGDGLITPAISVLSAVEGLKVIAPSTAPFVVPATIAILIILFGIQVFGTAKIGRLFGPVMLMWFAVLAALGVHGIVQNPIVLSAIWHPFYLFGVLIDHPVMAAAIFGSVCLAVTGAESFYADLGHCGRQPIRVAWFAIVLPALVLNYFGQGAIVLLNPVERADPFFHLAPDWAVLPLVLLSTMATVIASQALISGIFSVTRQAIQFGVLPRLRIIQTSSSAYGQIFIPAINVALMFGCIILVVAFQESDHLAAAYGIAVTATMLTTTTMLCVVMRENWRWSPVLIVPLIGLFATMDALFFAANLTKVMHGGWVPLVVASTVFFFMMAWRAGSAALSRRLNAMSEPFERFLDRIEDDYTMRMPGTAIFLTKTRSGTPPMLMHHVRLNRVLHKRVIFLSIVTTEEPRVHGKDRMEIQDLGHGFFRVIARYGFMQVPDMCVLVRRFAEHHIAVDPDAITYYLGHETIVPRDDGAAGLPTLIRLVYAFMLRNAARASEFFDLPKNQVMEIGMHVDV